MYLLVKPRPHVAVRGWTLKRYTKPEPSIHAAPEFWTLHTGHIINACDLKVIDAQSQYSQHHHLMRQDFSTLTEYKVLDLRPRGDSGEPGRLRENLRIDVIDDLRWD